MVHTTEGTNSLGWLLNPASEVSYTMLIPRAGPKIYRLGREGDAHWHAGIVCDPITTALYHGVNPNRESNGYALEGFARDPITAFQLETVVALIVADDKPWIGHVNLAGCNRTDPGAGNMALIAAELALGGDDMLQGDERQALFDLVTLNHEQKNTLNAIARHLGVPAMQLAAAAQSSGRESGQKGTWDGPGREPTTAGTRAARKKGGSK